MHIYLGHTTSYVLGGWILIADKAVPIGLDACSYHHQTTSGFTNAKLTIYIAV
jgi:hypothetical protein